MGKEPIGVSIDEELLRNIGERLDYGDSRSAFIEEAIREKFQSAEGNTTTQAQETHRRIRGMRRFDSLDTLWSEIEGVQKREERPDPLGADVIIAPRGEPSQVEFRIKASPNIHPVTFTLQLASALEDTLSNNEYGGELLSFAESGYMFIEDQAEEVFNDYEREY